MWYFIILGSIAVGLLIGGIVWQRRANYGEGGGVCIIFAILFALILLITAPIQYHIVLEIKHHLIEKIIVLEESQKLLGAETLPSGLEALQLKQKIVDLKISIAHFKARKSVINASAYYLWKVKD